MSQTFKGALIGLSEASLSLAAADRALMFAQVDVVEVRREFSDSVLNGGLIGLVAGFAGPAIFCTIRSDGSETVPCITGSFAFGGLPGLAIGAIVDAARTRKVVLFRAAGRRPDAVLIAPVLRPGRVELRASIRLGH